MKMTLCPKSSHSKKCAGLLHPSGSWTISLHYPLSLTFSQSVLPPPLHTPLVPAFYQVQFLNNNEEKNFPFTSPASSGKSIIMGMCRGKGLLGGNNDEHLLCYFCQGQMVSNKEGEGKGGGG